MTEGMSFGHQVTFLFDWLGKWYKTVCRSHARRAWLEVSANPLLLRIAVLERERSFSGSFCHPFVTSFSSSCPAAIFLKYKRIFESGI